jgi:hypothetical protein
VQTIGEICKVLDRRGPRPVPQAVAHTMDALAQHPETEPGTELGAARKDLLRFLRSKGLRVRPHARALDDLAAALVGLRQVVGPEIDALDLEPYLDAMCTLADDDYRANRHLLADPATAPEAAALAVVLGTVVWEPVLLLLRRIALEDVVQREWKE